MTPESISGLSIPRELVLNVLRGGQRVDEVRRLRVLAALAQAEPARRPDLREDDAPDLGAAA